MRKLRGMISNEENETEKFYQISERPCCICQQVLSRHNTSDRCRWHKSDATPSLSRAQATAAITLAKISKLPPIKGEFKHSDNPLVNHIIIEVTDRLKVPRESIFSTDKTRTVAFARGIILVLLDGVIGRREIAKLFGLNFKSVGPMILYAQQKVDSLRAKDRETIDLIRILKKLISANKPKLS